MIEGWIRVFRTFRESHIFPWWLDKPVLLDQMNEVRDDVVMTRMKDIHKKFNLLATCPWLAKLVGHTRGCASAGIQVTKSKQARLARADCLRV
jgi:hypothetical protein